jgi:hypothetical protein
LDVATIDETCVDAQLVAVNLQVDFTRWSLLIQADLLGDIKSFVDRLYNKEKIPFRSIMGFINV